jgi:arylsulfatase A-like enzyme
MAAVLRVLAPEAPDLLVVTLADVDRAGHAAGPESPEYARAVAGADEAIARLVDHLRRSSEWARSVVIVTADHGFTGLAPTADRPYPVITFGRDLARAGLVGVHVVADGGVEHVYADTVAAGASELGGAAPVLARVADLARGTPGVAEVLARLPLTGVPSLTSHADWHLAHERSGELLLVAFPGHQFVDPFDPRDAGLLGNHGGPGERTVPLIVTGGHADIRAAPAGAAAPESTDVAPTIGQLLGLRSARRLDGTPLPAGMAGCPIAAVLAATTDQSPHCAKKFENTRVVTPVSRLTCGGASATSFCGSTPAPAM